MMVREQKEKNKVKNLMAGTWTKAALVRREYKAGRPRQKDRVITPLVAIHEACILLDDLRNAMRERDLPVEDVRAAIILMVPNFPTPDRDAVHVLRVPEPNDLPDLFKRAADVATTGAVRPLGLAVWQMDRELGDAVAWVQPFLTGPRAVAALREAKRAFAKGESSAN